MPRTLLNEELHTAEWIKSQLGTIPNMANIAPGGAWLDLIPQDQVLPAIRYQARSRQDVSGATKSSQRIMVEIDWLVVGVVEGPGLIPLLPVADGIDAVLQGANGVTSTIEVMSCLRQDTFSLTEEGRSGVTFRHAGGIYRTLVVSL
jgi:hypothetical protein